MKINRLLSTVMISILLFYAQASSALQICQKPNGIATREVVYNDLHPLFDLIKQKLGSNKTFILVGLVPPEIQLTERFTKIENNETLKMLPYFLEEVKKAGFDKTESDIKKELLKPRSQSSINDDGLVYIYSNNIEILKRISTEIADEKGLVVEGSISEARDLFNPENQNSKAFNWWKHALPEDLDSLIFVGSDVSPTIRSLVGKTSTILKISDWKVATESGLKKARLLMDHGNLKGVYEKSTIPINDAPIHGPIDTTTPIDTQIITKDEDDTKSEQSDCNQDNNKSDKKSSDRKGDC